MVCRLEALRWQALAGRSIWLTILTLLLVFGLENSQFWVPVGSAVTRQWECAVSRSPRQPVISAARTGTVPMLGIDLAVTAGNRHRKDSLDRDKNINVTDQCSSEGERSFTSYERLKVERLFSPQPYPKRLLIRATWDNRVSKENHFRREVNIGWQQKESNWAWGQVRAPSCSCSLAAKEGGEHQQGLDTPGIWVPIAWAMEWLSKAKTNKKQA